MFRTRYRSTWQVLKLVSESVGFLVGINYAQGMRARQASKETGAILDSTAASTVWGGFSLTLRCVKARASFPSGSVDQGVNTSDPKAIVDRCVLYHI